ncbi:MAG: YidC/Oxa1 family membrane protein insertase [Clostridia bacterium]|nr:YidC/Oxa1 family membrane protein insertase [Clostridia bacterium]
MMQLFNFFGNLMGYLLWALYCVFKNYGVAIILFTLIIKIVLFPTSINQQKSMAKNAKLGEKQKELQKKYGNDRQRYNEELQKLYEKENMSPYSGCLTTLLPFPIMLGIYYSVIFPLKNTLHISAEAIANATEYVSKIPGLTSTGNYVELTIVKNWAVLKDSIAQFFTQGEIAKIESFEKGFKIFGINLLDTPKGSHFTDLLWLIPVLCILSYWASTFYMQKASGQKSQGCMNATMYLMPLLSAYWAYMMPGAVGFYWIISSVFAFAQSVIIQNFYSLNHMTAMNEAQHFVSMCNKEAELKPLSEDMQRKIAEKIESQANVNVQNNSQKNSKTSSKKKNSGAKKNNSSDYLGNKK